MKIGQIDFGDKAVFLAPLEDVTDSLFRGICKKFGADMMYTEFVSSEALIRDVNKTVKKMQVSDEERPVGIQIYGNKTESMVEAAKIAEMAKPDLIDINYGCPVRKIATKGGGAGMLRDIPKMLEMTEAVVKSTSLPVTVKTRLGWDDESKIIVQLAEQLQDTGIQALTIHGRTRAQMYTGTADWNLIGKVKNNPRMKIPIIGNGDIDTPEKAEEMFKNFGVDAVMIGRASISKPWIFNQTKSLLSEKKSYDKFTISNQVEFLKFYVQESVKLYEERRGIIRLRRNMAQSFKSLPHFKELRIQMLREEKLENLLKIFDQIAERYGDILVN